MWTMNIKEPKQHKNRQNQGRKTKQAIYDEQRKGDSTMIKKTITKVQFKIKK